MYLLKFYTDIIINTAPYYTFYLILHGNRIGKGGFIYQHLYKIKASKVYILV